jgi:hypothetical protein
MDDGMDEWMGKASRKTITTTKSISSGAQYVTLQIKIG